MPTLTDEPSSATGTINTDRVLLQTSQQINAGLELATEQYHNWKQILSGALNDRQLVCGLGILFMFYVFYSVFNTITGDKDEDNITCQCPLLHRWYYQVIVFGSGFIWLVCFFSIIIYDIYRSYMNPLPDNKPKSNNHDDKEATNMNRNHSKSNINKNSTTESTDDSRFNETSSGPHERSIFSKLDDKLKHCENHLWLEFYKAYSVGSGTYERISLPDIISIITREREDATRSNLCNVNNGNTSQGHDEPDFGVEEAEKIAKQSFFFFYPFLVIVRLSAQMLLVPVLILQMLNMYAWICFTENYHCKNTVTHYQLGLYQAYMTFGFYIALLIAILATTMLRWFPYSKRARNIDTATCA